jgi:putative transposase
MLNKNIEEYQNTKKFIFAYSMNNLLPSLKNQKETSWLKEIPSQCLQQKCQDLDTALKQSFKKNSNKKGFPKFKAKRTDESGIRFPSVKIENKKLILPKLGNGVKIKLHRPLFGKVGATTVIKDKTGAWYASVLFKVDDSFIPPKVSKIETEIGIDLGLKEFAITSDGELISNPKFYRKSEKRLKKLQRSHSKKTKGSKNREKSRKRLAKQHKKVSNQRKNFVTQVACSIAKYNDLICIESLNVKGMVKNHKLSKSISDVGWGMFTSALKWQATKRGKHLVEVGRFYPSSKTCNNCGSIKNDLTLSDRTFKCGDCGFELDRDLNAALNILSEGKRLNTAGTAEINACGDMNCSNSSAQEAACSLDAQ